MCLEAFYCTLCHPSRKFDIKNHLQKLQMIHKTYSFLKFNLLFVFRANRYTKLIAAKNTTANQIVFNTQIFCSNAETIAPTANEIVIII